MILPTGFLAERLVAATDWTTAIGACRLSIG